MPCLEKDTGNKVLLVCKKRNAKLLMQRPSVQGKLMDWQSSSFLLLQAVGLISNK